MAGFLLFRAVRLFGNGYANRTTVGFNPTQLVSAPEKQEQNEGQANTPGQAVDSTVPLSVVFHKKYQGGTKAVENDN